MNNKERLVFNKARYEGSTFPTNYGGEVKVLEYVNNKNILIEFTDTNHQKVVQVVNLLSGLIKDNSKSFLYSVEGIVFGNEEGRTKLLEYSRWLGILERCYCSKFHLDSPTYKDCTVSNNFKQFPYFKEWCNNQIGFNSIDSKGNPFHLDKDILIKGNKEYSENVCVFVPQEINCLLLSGIKGRGKYPIGVFKSTTEGKYVACINRGGISTKLGTYSSPEQAFYTYKIAKEEYIKVIANIWKDKIDIRVYETLMDYKINIDD